MSLRRDLPRRKARRRFNQVALDLILPGELRPWVWVGGAVLMGVAVIGVVIAVIIQPR